MTQITLDELNRMDQQAFVAALGDVFEHAPWVAETAHKARPFPSLDALYKAMTAATREAGEARQMALIKGHPDLAGKAAREGAITADSKLEQSSAGLDRLTEDEFAAFHRLNDAYRAKFGIPFIVCVRRHGKESILRQFEKRLRNDSDSERDRAGEIFRIAALRLDQRIAAADRLKVHGRLSTHVLDTMRMPCTGRNDRTVRSRIIGRAASDLADDHQCRRPHRSPADCGQPIPIAQYELRFGVGEYFEQQVA